MSAPWFSPSLFEDSSPDLPDSKVNISTRSTTSAALEINRILYNLPSVSGPFTCTICETYVSNQRQRSDSETSVYQDCINAYKSSNIDPYENNEENISSLGSNAPTQPSQTGVETDGTKVSGSSRDTMIAYEV
jgi:transcription elongation factor Elf1